MDICFFNAFDHERSYSAASDEGKHWQDSTGRIKGILHPLGTRSKPWSLMLSRPRDDIPPKMFETSPRDAGRTALCALSGERENPQISMNPVYTSPSATQPHWDQ